MTDGLGLDKAGIAHGPAGIRTDRGLRTTNRRVYAIGDCADVPGSGLRLTHVANYHAGLVIRSALFRMPAKVRPETLPRVTYTDPELAAVGLTEEEARARHGSVRVLRWPFSENDRAQAERRTTGHAKLVLDRKGACSAPPFSARRLANCSPLDSGADQGPQGLGRGRDRRALSHPVGGQPPRRPIEPRGARRQSLAAPPARFSADVRMSDTPSLLVADAKPASARPIRIGLSGRLLILTIAFVMLAEVLIYVPSVANFRRTWLNDRLAAAQVAATVAEAAPSDMLPPGLAHRLLDGIGAQAIAYQMGSRRILLGNVDMPPDVSASYDLRGSSAWRLILDAFGQLASPDPRPIRVIGASMGAGDFIEVVLDVAPLRAAMWQFSRNILILSLIISGITAGLVYLALQWLIVRPVRRMAENVMAFEENPEDESRRIVPDGRHDEIGAAQRAIARMQATLAQQLRQQKHLAALGLAVSKINHDLRNMLASAQLISDRLNALPDPNVQRFAPKLIAAIDRAIGFCEATLTYGAASEPPPRRRRCPWRRWSRMSPICSGSGPILPCISRWTFRPA